MFSSFVATSLKNYAHFSDLDVEITLSHLQVEKGWFSQIKRKEQPTAHVGSSTATLKHTNKDLTRVF